METLGFVALALGAASLLRTILAMPALRRWIKGARVRDFVAGETPPASIVVDGDPAPFLRQNYPRYEVLATQPAEADVTVRTEGAPAYDLVVYAHPAILPDPLFLRDAAAGGAVAFLPMACRARTPGEKLRALSANTDVALLGVFLGPRFAPVVARTREVSRIARRPVNIAASGLSWGDLRSLAAAPLSAAPLLLALAVPTQPGALTLLLLVAAARIALAVSAELRFVRDGSMLAALPWLPVLWIVEPWLLLFGGRRSATLGGR